MRHWQRGTWAAAFLGLAAIAPDALSQMNLTTEQIQAVFMGATMDGELSNGGKVTVAFGRDGIVRLSGSLSDQGTWRVSDGKYCTKYRKLRQGAEACYSVQVVGNLIHSFNERGELTSIAQRRP